MEPNNTGDPYTPKDPIKLINSESWKEFLDGIFQKETLGAISSIKRDAQFIYLF